MRATTWRRRVQSMVMEDGTSKGMKMVLEERGFNTSNVNMRVVLSNNNDFCTEKTYSGASSRESWTHCHVHSEIPLRIEPHREGMGPGESMYTHTYKLHPRLSTTNCWPSTGLSRCQPHPKVFSKSWRVCKGIYTWRERKQKKKWNRL